MKCEATTKTGTSCGMAPLKGGTFCYRHEPGKRVEALSASARGGQTKIVARKAYPAELTSLKTPEEASLILEDTIARVRAGKLHPSAGNSVALLLQVLLRTWELSPKKPAEVEPQKELERERVVYVPAERRLVEQIYVCAIERSRFAKRNNIPFPEGDEYTNREGMKNFFLEIRKTGFKPSLPEKILEWCDDERKRGRLLDYDAELDGTFQMKEDVGE